MLDPAPSYSRWGLPDWRETGAYPSSAGTSDARWRWEFLRRREDYRELWEKCLPETHRTLTFGGDDDIAYAPARDPNAALLKFGVSVIYDPRRSMAESFFAKFPNVVLDNGKEVRRDDDLAKGGVLEFAGRGCSNDGSPAGGSAGRLKKQPGCASSASISPSPSSLSSPACEKLSCASSSPSTVLKREDHARSIGPYFSELSMLGRVARHMPRWPKPFGQRRGRQRGPPRRRSSPLGIPMRRRVSCEIISRFNPQRRAAEYA